MPSFPLSSIVIGAVLVLAFVAAAAPVNVRILSQNVQFINFVNTVGNRGYGISALLLAKRPQYDVIVFQEVFVDRGRQELLRWLTPTYPHVLQEQQQSSENRNVSFRIYDSGLMVFSKFPIRQSWYTKFSQSSGLDYLSDKGAVVALMDVPGANNTSAPLLVAGTHMQAGGTNAIMKSQVDEMGSLLSQVYNDVVSDILSSPNASNLLPLTVACGDFNIRHTRKTMYKYMLAGLSNDTVDTFSALNPNQTTEGTVPGSKFRIDYVLHLQQFGDGEMTNKYAKNTRPATLVAAGIDRFAPETSVEGHAALSDHYGAWASFDLNQLVAGPPPPAPLEIPPMPTTPSPTTPPVTPHFVASGTTTTTAALSFGHWTSAVVIAAVTWIIL